MKRLSAFLLMAILGGGSALPANASGSWCPPASELESIQNPECVFNVPKREARARKRQWYAESRQLAQKLTVPYQDLVVAYLSRGKSDSQERYCLQLFDEKPDKALTRRLNAVKILPRSCYGPTVSVVYIHRITQESPNTFKVLGGSYCGPLCASLHTTIVTRNPDGSLAVGKPQLIWIS